MNLERRRILQTMGVVTAPLIAGCSGEDPDGDDPTSNDGDRDDPGSDENGNEVLLGLDFGGEHLTEAPVIDEYEFHPTSDTRTAIELEGANVALPEHTRWWDETLNFDPVPVAYNSNPEEGPQSDSLPTFGEIQGTEHDGLYQTAYWADEEFQLEVSLENGTYEVTLHLAEIFFSAEQERVFDVIINGEVVEEDLDIYAEVGEATALTISTEVEVTDNLLTVLCEASVNNPQLSGLEIRGNQAPIRVDESVDDFEPVESTLELIDADPDAGFHFPYFLYIPGISTPADGPNYADTRPLFVGFSPWAGETSEREERLDSGRSDIEGGRQRFIVEELEVPSIVALLPGGADDGSFRNLDHNSLQVTDPPTERLDLQLLAMVEDARDRLADQPYDVPEKFHLDGYSSRGRWASQFTMLHPERVNAISGGGNGTATIPNEELDEDIPTIGEPEMDRLPWAVGVSDLDDLIGTDFDREAWLDVNQFRYIGAEDQGDPDELDHPSEYVHSPSYRHFGEERQQLLIDIFGWKQVDERFETARAIYENVGAPAEFKIYEGIGHEVTPEIAEDIIEFHREQIQAEFGP